LSFELLHKRYAQARLEAAGRRLEGRKTEERPATGYWSFNHEWHEKHEYSWD
jgi:hypothetical protein